MAQGSVTGGIRRQESTGERHVSLNTVTHVCPSASGSARGTAASVRACDSEEGSRASAPPDLTASEGAPAADGRPLQRCVQGRAWVFPFPGMALQERRMLSSEGDGDRKIIIMFMEGRDVPNFRLRVVGFSALGVGALCLWAQPCSPRSTDTLLNSLLAGKRGVYYPPVPMWFQSKIRCESLGV